MSILYSKHNQVYPGKFVGEKAIEKYFQDLEDWKREIELYRILMGKVPCPKLLYQAPGVLITARIPAATMMDELMRQSREGFSPTPWKAIVQWLTACHTVCGKLPAEGNLRNFLWDSVHIFGLDFECYQSVSFEACGANLVAYILEYDGVCSLVRASAAEVIRNGMGVTQSGEAQALSQLRFRRSQKPRREISAAILAGGQSKRMGRDKAGIKLGQKTLLQIQVEKLQAMGIADIMVSGASGQAIPGVRMIPDVYPSRGPMGGMHACLRAARESACLFLSVDTPLVPVEALLHLKDAHRGGVTVLSHGQWEEPLIGVYDTSLANTIEKLIAEKGVPIRQLSSLTDWNDWMYLGRERLLLNCNFPEDIAVVEKLYDEDTLL